MGKAVPAQTASEPCSARLRIRVTGLVQGVGFRPHVYRLAMRFGIRGFVLNDCGGVLIEAEGEALPAFLRALRAEAPPLARIDGLEARAIPPLADEKNFAIRETRLTGAAAAAVPPDAALCGECLGELFDPADRRFLHPFIACSHCGPRVTIAGALPYDRARTSMAPFSMCALCADEYSDPADRRFHAEPIACPECGPQLDWDMGEIAARIAGGQIVAIKGLGGFHLACDARNRAAVETLRERKARDGKPFAVMVLNIRSAERLAFVPDAASSLLEGPERPIVILGARPGHGLAPEVANGLPALGLFLPSTPVHFLLFHALLGRPKGRNWLRAPSSLALVMTSANLSGEPILSLDREARGRLAGIADTVAGHDRAIEDRMDDSVVRLLAGAPVFLRRARGYVPRSIGLARAQAPVLALGAQLKSTIAVTRGKEAFLSQHLGDLDTPGTVAFLREMVSRLLALGEVRPERVACDLHPDFASSRLAEELAAAWEVPLVRVQHHHAHIAAVTAEHGRDGRMIGLALDGYGRGTDGGAWGGELLLVNGAHFERRGRLQPLGLPGGDRAAREPWRMAAAALHALGRTEEIAGRFADEPQAAALARLLRAGGVPETSSAGRLFDAAAGLLGVCARASFEAEAPMRLEALAGAPEILEGGWRIGKGELDLLPLLGHLADCADPARGAALFHGTFAAALADWVAAMCQADDLHTVALGGGCFLNVALTEALTTRLAARGFEVLLPRQVPPGDGGLSLGQAYVAGNVQH